MSNCLTLALLGTVFSVLQCASERIKHARISTSNSSTAGECWLASTGAVVSPEKVGSDPSLDVVCVGDLIKIEGPVHPRFGRVLRKISSSLFDVAVAFQFGTDSRGRYVQDQTMAEPGFEATAYSNECETPCRTREAGTRVFSATFATPDYRKELGDEARGTIPVLSFPACREFVLQKLSIERVSPTRSILVDRDGADRKRSKAVQYKRWANWKTDHSDKEGMWKELARDSVDLFENVCSVTYYTGRSVTVKEQGEDKVKRETEFLTIIPPSYEDATRELVQRPLRDLQLEASQAMKDFKKARAKIDNRISDKAAYDAILQNAIKQSKANAARLEAEKRKTPAKENLTSGASQAASTVATNAGASGPRRKLLSLPWFRRRKDKETANDKKQLGGRQGQPLKVTHVPPSMTHQGNMEIRDETSYSKPKKAIRVGAHI